MRRTVHKAYAGLQRHCTCTLRPDQCPRDVEAVLGKQLTEVIAGHTAFETREAAADQIRILVSKDAQGSIDFALTAPGRDNPLELLLTRGADPEAPAVIRPPSQFPNLLDPLSPHPPIPPPHS